MKKNLFYFLLFCSFSIFAQQKSLYDDTKVSSVFILMNTDSLAKLLKPENKESNHYYSVRFIFDDGIKKDTVKKVGFRLRGNTSRASAKKSFKVSFNTFDDTLKYQGVKKLNLNGSHNDPTMIREKLYYDIWNKAENPRRRVNLVRLYINKEYMGVYTNIEEIDKEWLGDVYKEKKGNLYKCTYPADLAYISDNQSSYKNIKNNPITRAYDLVTNEITDDYSDLVTLIKTINSTVDANYPAKVKAILNVESVLKSYAIEVTLGHWDNYGYNKNNYYLYNNLKTKKFEFISYDADNTMGVDWLGQDWAVRNIYKWLPTSVNEKRPLISKLMEVPEFKAQYSTFINDLTKKIIRPDSIFPRIDYLHDLIKTAAYEDKYKGLDYKYTNTSWEDGFTKKVDGHTPYGVKPFFGKRYTSTVAQVVVVQTIDNQEDVKINVFPNPTNQFLFIENESGQNIQILEILSLSGQLLSKKISDNQIDVAELNAGFYFLKMKLENGRVVQRSFVKI
jgi:hypothetical protein